VAGSRHEDGAGSAFEAYRAEQAKTAPRNIWMATRTSAPRRRSITSSTGQVRRGCHLADQGSVASNIAIHHNTVINSHGQTSAVMLSNYFGSVTNVIVDNNRLVEEVAIPNNRHKPEEIVAKLRQVDQVLANSYPDGRAPWTARSQLLSCRIKCQISF
jgi:hypothetical protein